MKYKFKKYYKTKKTKIQKNKHKNKIPKNKTKKNKYKKNKIMNGGGIIEMTNETIKFVNLVDNRYINKINIENCDYYFSQKKPTYDYNIFKLNNDFYIINNKDSQDDNMRDIINLLENETKPIKLSQSLLKLNTLIIFLENKFCTKYNYLFRAKEKIKEINNLLHTKCPNLQLEIDFIHHLAGNITKFSSNDNFNYLTLCLYDGLNCISSITISVLTNGTTIEISSKTHSNFEGKKYNKLLRAIIIVISKLLENTFENIISIAINPISAWLLITYFNAIITPEEEENEEFFKFLNEKGYDISNITKSILTEYNEYKRGNFGMMLNIPLTEENILNAETKYEKIINEELIC
jgi:hypothetical protein